jgi:hypothetical protein
VNCLCPVVDHGELADPAEHAQVCRAWKQIETAFWQRAFLAALPVLAPAATQDWPAASQARDVAEDALEVARVAGRL